MIGAMNWHDCCTLHFVMYIGYVQSVSVFVPHLHTEMQMDIAAVGHDILKHSLHYIGYSYITLVMYI